MKHFVLVFLLTVICTFAAGLPALSGAEGPLRGEEKTPFFPLGLWYEGGVGDARDNVLPKDPAEAAKIYDHDFADIEAHGINVITIPNSPPDHHKIVLDAAAKHHLKVILELGLDGGPFGHMIRGDLKMDDTVIKKELETVVDPIRNHPALLRVQLLDEPPAGSFERYGTIAAALKQFDPKLPPFCCLTGDSNGDEFLADSKSDVVAFDMYPFGPDVKEGDADHLKAFATYAQRFADWGEKHNAASWAVVQCHDITGQLRLPTAGELRCMTYASLATGNRGVFWFLYQSEHVGQALMGGLVDRDFKPRPLWDEVKKLSAEIQPLTTTLAKLTPDRATTLKVNGSALAVAYALRDADKALYVFAVNLDTTREQSPEIALPIHVPEMTVTDLCVPAGNRQRTFNPCVVDGAFILKKALPPGGGVLYRVNTAAPRD